MRKKFEPNEPYYAAHWFLNRLIPEVADKIDLSVYIRRISDEGVCWSYQDEPWKFTLVIDAQLGRRDSLRALAHESVHVMQHVTGKMKNMWKYTPLKVLWNKTKLMENSYEGVAYRNAPWEIEANAMQEKLMLAYLRHVRKFEMSGRPKI